MKINSMNKKKKLQYLIITLIVAGLFAVIVNKVWHAIKYEETDNAQIEMRLVPIISRVSGYVEKIYVDDYAKVKKGDLLVVIDSSELQLQLDEMQADYAQSLADIENAKASLVNARASLESSNGTLEVTALQKEKAEDDYLLDKNLFAKNAVTQKQFDDSRSNYEINEKQFELSGQNVKVTESHIKIADAQLAKAQAVAQIKSARIEEQKLKLSYCRIVATSDGVVGKRNMDTGQFIQAGAPLFNIVEDDEVWIVANYKESQVENINVGQLVNITLDGFSSVPIKGRVVSISKATGARYSLLPPDNATGNFVKITQRIPVKIEITDPEKYKDILRAGMSLTVSAVKSL